MEVYLQCLGVDILKYVENDYKLPNILPIQALNKRKYECNARSRNTMWFGTLKVHQGYAVYIC